MRILIADDERLNRSILEDVLKGWGYDVIVTENGNEAWEVLQGEEAPNLAILDWVMPGMDGIEICSRLRARESTDYVYAILLTAKTSREDIIKGLESGADDYIVKPFNAEELKNRIKIGVRIIELEQRILKIARTDGLTGLLNRCAFMERLESEVNRARRQEQKLGLIILDLDHFKRVNDIYGHQAGDLVLQEVSRCLGRACRSYDIIGRYGGEEIIACLPGTGMEIVERTAERFRVAIEDSKIVLPDMMKYINITASIGAAVLEKGSAETVDSLIKRADNALYEAKHQGRNRLVISPPEE